MPRPKPSTLARRHQLTEEERAYLLYGESPEWPPPLRLQELSWPNSRVKWSDLWDAFGPDLTREYAEQYPGCRPCAFWHFDAPEPRRQLSGGGVEAWTVPLR